MTRFALDIPIFIASPSDVKDERDIAEQEIRALAEEMAEDDRILLRPLRWEKDVYPTYGARVQEAINKFVRQSELVIVILWSTLGMSATGDGDGSGTVEELMLGAQQVFRGSSDDVFVYFSTANPPLQQATRASAVQEFRHKLEHENRCLYATYNTKKEFRQLIRTHLRQWYAHWRAVPPICMNTILSSGGARPEASMIGEGRLLRIKRYFDADADSDIARYLGRAAVAAYQSHATSGAVSPIVCPTDDHSWDRYIDPEAARLHVLSDRDAVPHPFPLRRFGSDVFFADGEWFAFFCAAGLRDRILANDPTAMRRIPYVNEIHQYLSCIVGDVDRPAIVQTLVTWLRNKEGVSSNEPVVRNFAAYVLGMLGAKEAEDDLAWAAANDRGTDVRTYCITSLGKLRSRRHLDLLVEFYGETNKQELRELIGQSICRTVGIAEYEL